MNKLKEKWNNIKAKLSELKEQIKMDFFNERGV
jgi:hypothetical protein